MNPYKFIALFCVSWIGGALILAIVMSKIFSWLEKDADA